MESSHCGAVGIVNREIVDSHRVINSVGHHGVQYALAGKEHNIGHHPIAGSRQVVEMRSSDYSDKIRFMKGVQSCCLVRWNKSLIGCRLGRTVPVDVPTK